MRIFQNKPFQRFTRRESIDIEALCEALRQAEQGQIDADLGGGVIKQRNPRRNEGKSGEYRSIILYRASAQAFFVYGFAKNERSNITGNELKGFKKLAKMMLSYNDKQLTAAVQAEVLMEVMCGE